MAKKRYTLTAALPYTNGPIHIGHLAGVYVPADIYARYLRLTDNDVLFICGSDEHGVAIPMKAKKKGSRRKRSLTSTITSSKNHLKLLVSLSTTTHAPRLTYTTKRPQISSRNCMNRVILLRKLPNSYMMRKHNNFWPTVL